MSFLLGAVGKSADRIELGDLYSRLNAATITIKAPKILVANVVA